MHLLFVAETTEAFLSSWKAKPSSLHVDYLYELSRFSIFVDSERHCGQCWVL